MAMDVDTAAATTVPEAFCLFLAHALLLCWQFDNIQTSMRKDIIYKFCDFDMIVYIKID